jgi:HSP20 family protein
MANLTIWDPTSEFASLRNTMDRLFDQAWSRPWTNGYSNSSPTTYSFGMDLFERGDEYHVTAVLPGVRAEDVDVSVQNNMLTITAHRKASEDYKDATWYIREVPFGQYSRQVSLPAAVDPEGVEAHMENGFLHLRLPKVAAARAHKIQINASNEAPRILEHSTN